MKPVRRLKKKSLPYEGLISTKRFTHMKNPEYVYIFVRQDLSREQQLVQAAHVAMVLGNKLNRPKADDIYFQVCGVPQLIDFRGVMDTLNARSLKFETFYEPDQGNTLTAIATYPVPRDQRGNLREFPLLRFNGNN